MTADWRKWLFYVAGAYDGLLGIAFLLFWPSIFRFYDVTPPNHPGYVQFPALLLVVFGFMFVQIARNPDLNRGLIVYGIALKAAYCGVVFWYRITGGIPTMWLPWAWIDLAFLILFVMARRARLGAGSK
jgi:hypothetical protein